MPGIAMISIHVHRTETKRSSTVPHDMCSSFGTRGSQGPHPEGHREALPPGTHPVNLRRHQILSRTRRTRHRWALPSSGPSNGERSAHAPPGRPPLAIGLRTRVPGDPLSVVRTAVLTTSDITKPINSSRSTHRMRGKGSPASTPLPLSAKKPES